MPATRRRDSAIDKRVGARIKMLRLERGLSQEQLGKEMGLTFQQVQKYEKGTNAVASTRIPRLCEILKIEPNDLFNGYDFQRAHTIKGSLALDVGIRVERLGPKARRTMVDFLDLIESNNDGREAR